MGMQSSHPPLYFSQCKKAPGKIQLLLPTSFAGSMAAILSLAREQRVSSGITGIEFGGKIHVIISSDNNLC